MLSSKYILIELLKEYDLNNKINMEGLFLNLILHGLDHEFCYRALRDISFFSADGSGSLRSRWQTFCFNHLWTKHWDNPFQSNALKNRTEEFYVELYNRLCMIDKEMTDCIVVSCCY